MEKEKLLTPPRRWFLVLFFLTLLIGVPPLVIYAVARLNGTLPSEASWSVNGGNHGPWWGETIGLYFHLVFLGLLAMPFYTALVTLFALKKGTVIKTLAEGAALFLFQVFCFCGFVFQIFWTID